MSDGDALQGSEQRQEYGPQTESAWRLVAAAIGWTLLGITCSFVIGVLIGLVGASSHVQEAARLTISVYAGVFGSAGVLLAAAMIRGRIVGSGNISAGLGNNPVSRLPMIVCLALVAVAYAVLLDFVSPARPSVTLWAASLNILRFAMVGPLAEESLWRGWLWTGLQKHWGVLPTALLTSTFWLALHVGLDPIIKSIALIPVAIILAMARYFGQSVRAPVALHAIYNLVILV
jgi:membrane protease YdiL (CAAX protease family)